MEHRLCVPECLLLKLWWRTRLRAAAANLFSPVTVSDVPNANTPTGLRGFGLTNNTATATNLHYQRVLTGKEGGLLPHKNPALETLIGVCTSLRWKLHRFCSGFSVETCCQPNPKHHLGYLFLKGAVHLFSSSYWTDSMTAITAATAAVGLLWRAGLESGLEAYTSAFDQQNVPAMSVHQRRHLAEHMAVLPLADSKTSPLSNSVQDNHQDLGH